MEFSNCQEVKIKTLCPLDHWREMRNTQNIFKLLGKFAASWNSLLESAGISGCRRKGGKKNPQNSMNCEEKYTKGASKVIFFFFFAPQGKVFFFFYWSSVSKMCPQKKPGALGNSHRSKSLGMRGRNSHRDVTSFILGGEKK